MQFFSWDYNVYRLALYNHPQLQTIISMGNIIAQLHLNTVFAYGEEGKLKGLVQDNAKRIIVHKVALPAPVFELSFALFVKLLQEHNANNQAQDGSIDVIHHHECHNDWLKSYQGAKVKISSKEVCVSNINKQPLFNFVTKASPLNFGIKCDRQSLNYKAEITEQHIRLELGQQVQILRVGSEQKIVYRSNLGEDFHSKIIIELLARHNKDILMLPFSEILEQIFEKGNHQATDLLVADIFGQENCAFIGLPPKLIAASLGKLNNQHTVWDEAKSILVAFAINIGLQLKQQILTHKIYTAVVSANEFSHPAFFHLIQGLAGLFGTIWFHPHPTLQSFITKLQK